MVLACRVTHAVVIVVVGATAFVVSDPSLTVIKT